MKIQFSGKYLKVSQRIIINLKGVDNKTQQKSTINSMDRTNKLSENSEHKTSDNLRTLLSALDEKLNQVQTMFPTLQPALEQRNMEKSVLPQTEALTKSIARYKIYYENSFLKQEEEKEQNVSTLSTDVEQEVIEVKEKNQIDNNTEDNNADKHIEKMLKIDFSWSEHMSTSLQEKLNEYILLAINAYKKQHIFTVFGNFLTIRNALAKRGWLEKLTPDQLTKLEGLTDEELLKLARAGNFFEKAFVSNIMEKFPTFFLWQYKSPDEKCTDVLPYRNRLRSARNLDFTSKIGLIDCVEQESWYRNETKSAMSYPRFYRLGEHEESEFFINDFRQTQCRNLIRFLCGFERRSRDVIDATKGTIPSSILNFTLDCLRSQIDMFERKNMFGYKSPINIKPMEWKEFIENSSLILNKRAKVKTNFATFKKCIVYGKFYLEKLETKRSDFKWDGYRNLWILKPGRSSRGCGIAVMKNVDEILEHANKNIKRNYIVQKYIELPLLIYKTKFDIRMYMLLSITQNEFRIWLYKDCYLRFSSQQFSFNNLREEIHLTNNSVQKHYKNDKNRDARLPADNMWSLEQFKKYLCTIQRTDEIWNTKIFPGFISNLIAVVRTGMEDFYIIDKTFELYGCDFMIDENFNPILIEINSSPDLSPSTEVTKRLCPLVLEDLIKVVVDLNENENASTGQFDLVFKVNHSIDIASNANIFVIGQAFKQPVIKRKSPVKKNKTKNIANNNKTKQTNVNNKAIKNEQKKVSSVEILGHVQPKIKKIIKKIKKKNIAKNQKQRDEELKPITPIKSIKPIENTKDFSNAVEEPIAEANEPAVVALEIKLPNDASTSPKDIATVVDNTAKPGTSKQKNLTKKNNATKTIKQVKKPAVTATIEKNQIKKKLTAKPKTANDNKFTKKVNKSKIPK